MILLNFLYGVYFKKICKQYNNLRHSLHVKCSENMHVLPVILVEMQQERLPSMYSQVMKAAQDQSGLVMDEVTVKINREEEEETYGRGK